ncbi:MAG TPA: hypothetical protein VH079_02835 [Terriglobales bacterium]|nr:hypothetical protein [Terriglobales bacterium]
MLKSKGKINPDVAEQASTLASGSLRVLFLKLAKAARVVAASVIVLFGGDDLPFTDGQ